MIVKESIWHNRYLITKDVHDILESGYLDYKKDVDNTTKDFGGAHLVFVKILNKDKNILVYNYLYYNSKFTKLLLYFLITKHNFVNTMTFKEYGDFLTIIDHDLIPNDFININELLENNEYIKVFKQMLHDSNMDKVLSNYVDLFDIIKKTVWISDIVLMSDIVNCAINRRYLDFFGKNLNGLMELDYNQFEDNKDYNLNMLNGCLFIVKDLDKFINNIRDKNYNISQGPQSTRGQMNSLTNFLSFLDADFRNNLYRHNRHHIRIGNLDSKYEILRNRFTFKNVHTRIGNVKWYSTSKNYVPVLEEKYIKNRDELFQLNYRVISEILDNNGNVGSVKIQEEIESILHNQENFLSDKDIYNKIKYTEESFNLLLEKISMLNKLLSNVEDFSGNTQFNNVEYIPWVKKIILELGHENISNMLLSYFLEVLSKEFIIIMDVETPGIPAITSFNDFGKKIINKYIYIKFKNSENKYNSLSDFKENNKNELYDIYNKDNFYARIGGFFVWNLVTVGLLYQDLDNDPSNPKQTEYYLRVYDNVRSILMKNNKKVFHLPQKLPMVCKPKDFVYSLNSKQNKLGGYLLNDLYYTNNIFKDKIGYGESTILNEQNIVVNLINGLSKTPFKVNVDTLHYIYKYGIVKNILIDDSNEDIKTFIYNPYKSFNKRDRKKYRSIMSQILLQRNILSIAETYSKIDKIYFPVRLDHRTRIYCETDYFDYQKNDLAKGLISFSNPGIINKYDCEAIKYFKAYGANMYGDNMDKKSINYRVKWTDDNTDKILNFENNDIVDKSENKTCFISFCFEYQRFMDFIHDNDKTIFYTYLPIQLDATCNGYQHLVLLTKESKLWNKLNLDVSTHDDDPDDFYTYILQKTDEYINNKISLLYDNKNKTDKESKQLISYEKLSNISFGRSIVKKTIMTKSYNAGIPKQVDLIISNLVEQYDGKNKYYIYKDPDIKIKRDDIVSFVVALKYTIETESPKIKELSKYLNGIVNIYTKLHLPIPWILPSGAEIRESYEMEKKLKIKAFSFVKSRYTFKNYIKGEYDIYKQRRATMPNLIHSLDATTIALLYNDFNNKDLYTVHDCFAVTANHVPYLVNKLKMVYLKLYSSNSYLTQFDRLARININKILGDKIFSLDGKFVNIPVKNDKYMKIPFPTMDKIIVFDKDTTMNNLLKSSNIIV